MSFWAALTLLFIYLKLTKHIDWSWLVVWAPLTLKAVLMYIVERGPPK